MKYHKTVQKVYSILLCAVLGSLLFAGCTAPVDIDKEGAPSAAIQDFPVTVNETTIGAKPQKVAVLSASLADTILAMGYEGSLVLASQDCTQPELEALNKVSTEEIQAVVDAGADLVLSGGFTDDQTEAFATAKITALTIVPAKDRADYERMYSQIGSAMSGASTGYNNGVTTAQKIFTTLDDLSRSIPTTDKVTTACILTDGQAGAVTGDMIGSTVLSYSGMTNVFQGATGGTYAFEQLKITNPDIIFCLEGLKSELMSSSTFSVLEAVKNDRVYEIPVSYALWEGRSVVSAAIYFAGVAYPELREESSASVTLPEVVDATPEPEASINATPVPEGTYATLKLDDQGDAVMEMQTRLNALGYLAEGFDGTYNADTEAAVRAFQIANGMGETGVADVETQKQLFAENAAHAPDPANAQG